jgi:hypothetical protein
VVTERSPGDTYGGGAPAATAAKPDSAALSRATAPAGARAGDKADGSGPRVGQHAATSTVAVPVATAGTGLLHMDVVVSQVNCAGAQFVEAAAPVKPAVLPHTGANGHATRDLGVAGLGLIVAGSTAIGVARRRRGPVAN